MSISMPNNAYGYSPVKPSKMKAVSEENQAPPTEQVPSSSYGVQGGKVALQAGGTVLGAGVIGGCAGMVTHSQEKKQQFKELTKHLSEGRHPDKFRVASELSEQSFFDELFKGGKTTKVAGGVALGALLLGAGLTAYSAYQDGQRKPPADKSNFSMNG